MTDFLPVSKPDIGQAEIDEVVDSLRSGWITTGPKVRRLEEALAQLVGAPAVVALSSCTAGLHLSLLGAGVGPGDEVIVSALTFVSAVNVVMHVGATPVLADVDPATLNVSPESVARCITPRTKAIQVVHYGGQPCDLDEMHELANLHELTVIEDAAHAIGARYKNRPIGSISPFTSFSFYAIKNITTAEGGCLALLDPEKAERAREAGMHGMSRDAWKRYSSEGSWSYDVVMPGFKYNMTDIQAALGLHQLRRLGEFNRRRAEIVARYAELLAPNPAISLPETRPDRESAHHLMVVRVSSETSARTRDELIVALKEEGIGTTVNFIPVYRFTAYREQFDAADYPGCESVADEILTLPLFPAMTDSDVERVADALNRLTAPR